MEKLCLFFLLALFASAAIGMNVRHKRQSPETDDSIDERYGGDTPNQGPMGGQFPRQFTGQNFFPNVNEFLKQQQQQQVAPTTAAPDNGAVTRQCILQCPVTPEYNPVCGTDSVTYTNPGRLECAKACGISVSLLRRSPCPATTVAPN